MLHHFPSSSPSPPPSATMFAPVHRQRYLACRCGCCRHWQLAHPGYDSSMRLFSSRCRRYSCSHSSRLQCRGPSWSFVGSSQRRGEEFEFGRRSVVAFRLSFGPRYARWGDRKRGRKQKKRAGDRHWTLNMSMVIMNDRRDVVARREERWCVTFHQSRWQLPWLVPVSRRNRFSHFLVTCPSDFEQTWTIATSSHLASFTSIVCAARLSLPRH